MEIFNPHDKFSKETFSIRENVIDFLQGTFPEEILNKLKVELKIRGFSPLTVRNYSFFVEKFLGRNNPNFIDA